MCKRQANFDLIFFIIFIIHILFSCNNKKNESVIKKVLVYKSNDVQNGLIGCNTDNNKILIVDSLGNKKYGCLKNYSSELNYPPIIIDNNSVIIEVGKEPNKSLIKYRLSDFKPIWKIKTKDKIVSHNYLNDSAVILGFDSGRFKLLHCNSQTIEDVQDFSKRTIVYSSIGIDKIADNDLYVLSPILGSNSIVKINIGLKKILWEVSINHNFINFITTKKSLFYIAANDFGKGELGIIDLKSGKKNYNKKAFPNVITNPILINQNQIYYGSTDGKIMAFSLTNFMEKVIYISQEKGGFLGVGSANLYLLEDYIYFMDYFKIYRINSKTSKIEFVKNYDMVGFNFVVKNQKEVLEFY